MKTRTLARAKRPTAVCAILVGLLLSSCGSDSKSTSTAAATPQASTGSTTPQASPGGTSSGACKEGSGPPVKFLSILEESQAANIYQTSLRAGVDAAVKRVNCQGGLGEAGSPIEVDYCVSNLDPNAVNACANRATGDQGYVAAVGGGAAEGEPATILAAAGVPNIPKDAYGSDITGATTFLPFLGGGLLGPGEPIMACQLGYKKVSLLLIQVPAAAQVTDLDNAALKSYGCPEISNVVPVPATATDLSAQVTAASQGADAVVIAISPSQATSAFKVREQLGITTPFISNSGTMSAEVIKAAGSATDGLLVEMQTYLPPPDASVPGVTQFRADMATIGKTSEVDGNSAAGWLAVDLVATAAQGLATVDRASLLQALGSISSYDGGGMIPPTDFTKAAPLPNFPRLFNTSFSTAVLQNGQFQVEPKLEPFIPFFKAAG